jgi:hypothetical protein
MLEQHRRSFKMFQIQTASFQLVSQTFDMAVIHMLQVIIPSKLY